jgi:hypothetical protein
MHMKRRTTILIALALVWPVVLPCWAATHDNHVMVRLKPPGEPDVNTTNYSQGATRDTRVVEAKITATIVDIDKAVSMISFAGPNGWSYSQVFDRTVLDQVRVGDKVDIAWSTDLKVSVE